jgi:dTDP-4-amino-4,6-dideoxygalactose transaminase
MNAALPPIPFNRPYETGNELAYMRVAIESAQLAGNGPFAARCAALLEHLTGARRALLTHSCTGALELALTLAEIGPEDEVVMPSFTFVSTANSVVARGGTPVFVDIDPDTLCLDERLLEDAVTEKTKAVVPVHYAGVTCGMDEVGDLAARHGLVVIEDAAQGIAASLDGRPLGAIGELGALSFHETKNVSCGEGGALLINDERFVERAEVIHEKGTDRQRFFRGLVDKYTWVDVGSSYVLSDLAAAYLFAQLEQLDTITAMRLATWDLYNEAFAELEAQGDVRRPFIPGHAFHNAHMYYLLARDLETRTALIDWLAKRGINALFHYVPLHSSAAGRRYARTVGSLDVTTSVSDRLLRLPLWAGMSEQDASRVANAVRAFYGLASTAAGDAVEHAPSLLERRAG